MFTGNFGVQAKQQNLFCVAGVAVALLVFAPGLLNLAINAALRACYAVPGAFYQVNGRSMHLYCTGRGSPTVVLEAGGGDDWLIWQRVQPELAGKMRVCSYDRAGTGWSDPQPGLRDAKHIADQLHLLLQQADEKAPFVLVGLRWAGSTFARLLPLTRPKLPGWS